MRTFATISQTFIYKYLYINYYTTIYVQQLRYLQFGKCRKYSMYSVHESSPQQFCTSDTGVARTWLERGSNVARTWLEHGSNTWLERGSNMARTWLEHVARTWLEHVARTWPERDSSPRRPQRRARRFANHLLSWSTLTRAVAASSCFSRAVGYGRATCASNHAVRTATAAWLSARRRPAGAAAAAVDSAAFSRRRLVSTRSTKWTC